MNVDANRLSRAVIVGVALGVWSVSAAAQGQFSQIALEEEDLSVLAGSCCVDGTCVGGVTQSECVDDFCGTWRGDGTTCAGGPLCSTAFGVCCLAGSCTEIGIDACTCAGGVFHGGTCATVVCEPVGRCCVGAACVPDQTQQQCDNQCGLWGGAGSDCNSLGGMVPCGSISIGLCCMPDESCSTGGGPLVCQCNGGVWHGNQFCGTADDCNTNGIVDLCENVIPDCNSNGVPDECEADCNTNGIPDDCELGETCFEQEVVDCNFDDVIDACDPDCDMNGESDICEMADEINGIIECTGATGVQGSYLAGQILHNNSCAECHGNGGYGTGGAPNHRNHSRYEYQRKTSDCQDVVAHPGGAFPFSLDDHADLQRYLSDFADPSDSHGGDGIPDGCQIIDDCDGDGIADECELSGNNPLATDCNENGEPDNCDIAAGSAEDCNTNSIPDSCEPFMDCNLNAELDSCDVVGGTSLDCNNNLVPDECEQDCNTNGIPDDCEGLPDCNTDGIPDICDPDCNANSESDVCEILGGAPDCDSNGVLDECQPDCNSNAIADACDIAEGSSADLNVNKVPDECDPDCNSNGLPDDLDIGPYYVGNAKTASVDYGTNGPMIVDCNIVDDEFLVDTLTVDFGGECALVEHLSVDLRLTHDYVGDLVISLESPSGTIVTLVSRVDYEEIDPYCSGGECCGADSQDMDVRFDDLGSVCAEFAAVNGEIVDGTLHPHPGATGHAGELAAFAGEMECGAWTLTIHDAAEFDAGWLEAWSLHFFMSAVSGDCNNTGVPDECEIAAGTSADVDSNGVPDECFVMPDCNSNGIFDPFEVSAGSSEDCNNNGLLDECEVTGAARLLVSGSTSNNVVEHDTREEKLIGEFVKMPTGCDPPIDFAAGMAFGANGNLFLTNLRGGSVYEYDSATGAFLGLFADGQSAGLIGPIDVAFNPTTGNLLVLPVSQASIWEFDGQSGDFVGTFASTTGLKLDMVIGPNDNLFVGLYSESVVMQFDSATGADLGNFISVPGPLISATSLAFNPANGNLTVLDAEGGFIREFDGASGAYIRDIAQVGSAGASPVGMIAYGPDGDLYFAHYTTDTVARLDPVTGDVLHILPPNPITVGTWDILFRPTPNDCNGNQIPDECEDCNENGLADSCDIAAGTSADADSNGVPDECQGEDAQLALVVRNLISTTDSSLGTPPRSVDFVETGSTFFVELWATDVGALNTGLAQVYADLSFSQSVVTVTNVAHRPPFTSQPGGIINQPAGLVGDLGGQNLFGGAVGIAPEWVRVAIVEFTADGCEEAAAFSLSPGASGVVAIGRGLIDPANIVFGSNAISVGVECVYNLDASNSLIDAADLGIFAGCWLTGPSTPGFDPACDFDCSGFVDAADLGWFSQGWLQECSELVNGDLPPCKRCGGMMMSAGTPNGSLRPDGLEASVSPVHRDGDVLIRWTMEPATASAGEEVSVVLEALDPSSDSPGLAAVFTRFEYDAQQLELMSVEHGASFPALTTARPGSNEIAWLGGGRLTPEVSLRGWTRVATVRLRALIDLPTSGPKVSIRPEPGGVARFGQPVDAERIRVWSVKP